MKGLWQWRHSPLFYAQPHAKEISRKSGAWGAQRAGEENSSLLGCIQVI